MWMHNGGVFKFEKIKQEFVHRLTSTSYSMISGTTDSEHLGALFIDHLPENGHSAQHSSESIVLAMK
jgi:glutamine amidotransferase